MLAEKIKNMSAELHWTENLHDGTDVHKEITKLNAKSDMANLKLMACFEDKETDELDRLEADLKELNLNLLNSEIQLENNHIAELQRIAQKFESISKVITQEIGGSLVADIASLKFLEHEEVFGLSEIATKYGVEAYQSKEFGNFLRCGGYVH